MKIHLAEGIFTQWFVGGSLFDIFSVGFAYVFYLGKTTPLFCHKLRLILRPSTDIPIDHVTTNGHLIPSGRGCE